MKPTLRHHQALCGFITGALATGIVHNANLSGLWNVIAQETGRGVASIAYGSPWASLGLIAYEETILYRHPALTLVRIALLTLPHIALGLLWQRYALIGGSIAIAEHIAWNRWLISPRWPIPVLGMGLIYLFLYLDITDKEST